MRAETTERKKYLTWAVSEARRKIKVRAVEYKGGKCTRCGYSKCIAALQFHHLDSETKEFRISRAVLAWEKVQVELDKTVLLCANCHSEVHHEETEIRRQKQEREIREATPVRTMSSHGASRYSTGCRCTECKAGHAQRIRKYKKEKRAVGDFTPLALKVCLCGKLAFVKAYPEPGRSLRYGCDSSPGWAKEVREAGHITAEWVYTRTSKGLCPTCSVSNPEGWVGRRDVSIAEVVSCVVLLRR